MNILLLKAGELNSSNHAFVEGKRAKYIYEYHDLKPGLKIKAGIIGGAIGKADIIAVSPQRIELVFSAESNALPFIPVCALVATPRPQSVKKILQLSAMQGLSSLCFFRSENVVKSYLDSKSLEPEAIEEQLILGLEQAGNSLLPSISICSSFHELTSKYFQKIADNKSESPCLKLLADTQGKLQNWSELAFSSHSQEVIVAVGPESGFSTKERTTLCDIGFLPVSLGARMLRVDIALNTILARVELLREFSLLQKP